MGKLIVALRSAAPSDYLASASIIDTIMKRIQASASKRLSAIYYCGKTTIGRKEAVTAFHVLSNILKGIFQN